MDGGQHWAANSVISVFSLFVCVSVGAGGHLLYIPFLEGKGSFEGSFIKYYDLVVTLTAKKKL